MKDKQFNHMMDVAFTIVSTEKDPYDIEPTKLVNALQARVDYLRQHPNEVLEALGYSDSYEVG